MKAANAGYDNIVIGAGSSGSVVVRRLVDRGRQVLLLEAGGSGKTLDRDAHALVPAMWHTEFDWDFYTEPQESLNGRVLHWPRGKVLGGSSSICGLVYARGTALDYNEWAEDGCSGWDFQSVLPYFRNLEAHDGEESELRGKDGLLPVSRNQRPSPVTEAFVAACQEAGVPYLADYNNAVPLGVSYAQHNIKDGRRISAWDAFGQPAAQNPCLAVVTDATVSRLLFDGEVCTGVAYLHEGREVTASARHEVIVCAGAIGSPTLLLSSGIGPADELHALGIPVVADLAGVGRNLHDHVTSPVVWEASRAVPPAAGQDAEAHLYWRSDPSLPAPDILPIFIVDGVGVEGYERASNGFSCHASLARVHSRGSVRLRSADPFAPPLIDPAVFTDPRDLDAVVAALELAREIGRQPALKDWATREAAPGSAVQTRADLRDYARKTSGSAHHQAGTCRMGVDSDAVVDPLLRVRGVTNLRVADMSVAPTLPRANTNGPAMMIGEKAADLVLAGAP